MTRMLTKEEVQMRCPNTITLIGEYSGGRVETLFKCKTCGEEWFAKPEYMTAKKIKYGCPRCATEASASAKRLSNKEILSRIPSTIRIVGDYHNTTMMTLFHCNVCNQEWTTSIGAIINGDDCPFCNGRRPIPYKTDIATLYPDFAKLFVNEEDTHKYLPHSNEFADFKCPLCGSVANKQICAVFKNGVCCQYCGDGISYPNKFVRSVLAQLDICFEPEYLLDGRYYDNSFIYDDVRYLIEVDGKQHYTNRMYYAFGKRNDFSIDMLKQEIANKYGYKIIRIDAIKSDKEYLKKSILNSELSKMFDMSSVNFEDADKQSMNSLMMDVINEYNNRHVQIIELAKEFGLSRTTVRSYLKRGSGLGLCEYNANYSTDKMVYCNENNTYYKTIAITASLLGLNASGVSNVCNGKRKSTGKLTFRFVEDKERERVFSLLNDNGEYKTEVAV